MSRAGWWAGRLAVVALMASTAMAADPQVRFRMDEPFRLGSHDYAQGVIALHDLATFTPSESILEVWVNGECLGMMTAHRSSSEEPPRQTEALFRRDGDGRLEMVGFRVAGRPKGTTYRFAATPSVAPSRPLVAISYGTN